ncbi:unnamed protein product [Clonostachys rosea f. rosea IK726]|uniref:Uncharacterized protein n=1 Tax=Clonostachys rosea f. rosea IK726 TaxID=1349383 RepID=A0ACA9UA00_BIOOC|nr:unnamed protein product [Clonostachys rosea f. rosea IK726]
MLPALRLVKEQQPLPNLGGVSYSYRQLYTISPGYDTRDSPRPKRAYSQRKIMIGTTPKNASPTTATYERSIAEMPSLDPAGAAERAVLSSTHLAAMNGSAQSTLTGYPSPNIPSPTSPQTHLGTLASRSYAPSHRPQQRGAIRTTATTLALLRSPLGENAYRRHADCYRRYPQRSGGCRHVQELPC